MTEREFSYAEDAIRSGWISSKGQYIQKFEQAWASWNGTRHGVACSSGTNALLLALRALGIREGDEVIVPDFTMVATAWAVTYCGAKPVFVDCGEDLTIEPRLIERSITSRTRAIMPVHVYGRQCDMDAIMKIAREYNLFVVEDSAEAHGVKPMGDIACFSFFGNKIITTGEGGMCLTSDPRLADQMEHLRSMAFDAEHTFLHKKVGYNFRMTNVQAAIGLAQVERIDEILIRRREIEKWYDSMVPEDVKMPKRDVLWMYDVRVGELKNEVKAKLEVSGVETRHFFKPMTRQPMYREERGVTNAYRASLEGIYLPTYTDMTREHVKEVCDALTSALGGV